MAVIDRSAGVVAPARAPAIVDRSAGVVTAPRSSQRPVIPAGTLSVEPPYTRREVLARSATPAGPRQQTVAGDGSVIPVIYGADRYGGQFAGAMVLVTTLYLLVVWGMGEIDSIDDVRMYDNPLPLGVSASHHLGTMGQSVDSAMVTACLANGRVYTDALPGIAYSVFGVPSQLANGFPTFSARIRGRKVATSSGGTPVWSDNPAYCIADFVENSVYGMGLAVDWDSVATVAARCDELIGTPAEKRRTLNITMDKVQPVGAWLDTLRAYAGCQVINEAGVVTLVPNAPSSSVMTFGSTNIVEDSTKATKRGTLDTPTVVRVRFTNTSTVPYFDDYATAPPGGLAAGVPRRESQVDMPGVNRYSQAMREAIEQLNSQRLSDLSVQFAAFDEGVKVQKGDVITLSDPVGLDAKLLRVGDVKDLGFGRYAIGAGEYDEGAYSDHVITQPSTPDTNYPSPLSPPPVTSLALVEEVFQLRDGTYSSRIKATWSTPAYPFVDHFRIEVTAGGQLIQSGNLYPTAVPTWRSQALQELTHYTVNVYVVANTLGGASVATSATLTVLGKYLVPSNVASLQGFEAGGKVYLRWSASVDVDTLRYELRYGVTGGSWDTATVLDRVDALTYVAEGLAAGSWRFYVSALDSVGQYSASPATCDVTISLDADAFIAASHRFAAASLTNMTAWQRRPDPLQYWSTDFGDGVGYGADDPDDTVGTFGDSLADTVLTEPHTPGDSEWLSEAWDYGAAVTGNWMLAITYTEHAPTATPKILLSNDDITYTPYYGTSAKGTARYVKAGLEVVGGSATVAGYPTITLAQSPRKESTISVMTQSSGGKLVQLANKYAVAKTVQIQPIGATPGTANPDRILVAPESGLKLVFDLSASGSALQTISRASRTIGSGDHLEYSLWLAPETADLGATITVRIVYTDTSTRDVSATWASGQWVAASAALTADIGKTIDYVILRVVSTVAGRHAVLLRDLLITDGAGSTRQTYWSSGEPASNTTYSQVNATNINMGPANSLLVYAFDTSWTQVAREVSVTFEGA